MYVCAGLREKIFCSGKASKKRKKERKEERKRERKEKKIELDAHLILKRCINFCGIPRNISKVDTSFQTTYDLFRCAEWLDDSNKA